MLASTTAVWSSGMSLYLMLLGSSQSREGISASHLLTDVTDKCDASPSPPCFGVCWHSAALPWGWWGWHCAMVRLSLPCGGAGPALWLSRSWLVKHPAPGRGGRGWP